MPAFIRLKYSWVTSLMVGSDSFMVNCCALAGSAASKPPATRPSADERLDDRVHLKSPP